MDAPTRPDPPEREGPRRRPYVAPELRSYGDLRRLTRSTLAYSLVEGLFMSNEMS
jgi:hypothetical protein